MKTILNEKAKEIARDYLEFANEFPISVDDYLKIRNQAVVEVGTSFFSGQNKIAKMETKERETLKPPIIEPPKERPKEIPKEVPNAPAEAQKPQGQAKTLAFKPKEKKTSMLDMMRAYD